MATKQKPTPPSKAQSKQSVPPWQPPLGAKTPSLPKRWQPHAYQKKAVKFLLERGAAALFLDPGLGKTSITAAVLKVLKRDGQMRGALVIAPLRPAQLVWPAEFNKWEDFKGMSVGVLHGPKRQQVLEADHDVYVINHDGLPWLFKRYKATNPKTGKFARGITNEATDAGKLLLSKVNILVLDELSKFKHTDTNRFKLLQPWLRNFDRRYGLTGSPAANGLLDLFGQCLALDDGRSLGPYVTYYKQQYFTPVDKMGYNLVLKPGAAELIYERVHPLALSMSAEDHMELPTLRNMPIKLDMPAAVRHKYDEMEEEFFTLIGSEALTSPNAASSNMALRQICSGAVYASRTDLVTGLLRTGPREVLHLHDVKLDAMADLLEELQGAQVLIAYEFQHDADRIQKRWPGIPRFGVSAKKDAELVRAWNAGQLQYVLGHPASIGHGLNLQDSNAHNVLWFTLTWDYELYDQFVRRLLRQGNKAAYINVYSLVMRSTVEESVAYSLVRKKRDQDDFTNAIKTRKRLE